MRIIRNIAIVLAAAFVGASAMAQEPVACGSTRLTVAVSLGAGSGAAITAPSGTLATYGIEAPSGNWMDRSLRTGLEGGILIGPHWRITVGGAFSFASNPPYSEVPGTADPYATAEENWGEVPNYSAVALQRSLSYMLYVGGDYGFNIPSLPCLRPYAGVRVAGAYASNQKVLDDPLSMGSSIAESYSIRTSLTAGADYSISKSLFVGIGFDVLNYTYAVSAVKPQQGLGALAADSHTIGAFAQPVFKLGVMF